MPPDKPHLDSRHLAPFRTHLKHPDRYHGLLWWYDFGALIRVWKTSAGPPREWVEDLRQVLDVGKSDDRIRRPWKFANTFKRTEVERLAQKQVNWSHIRAILGLPKADQTVLLRKLVSGTPWTIQQLNGEIRRLKAGSERSPRRAPRRRRFDSPRDNVDALDHLSKMTHAWCTVAGTGDWETGLERISESIEEHRTQFPGLDEQVTLTEWRLKELVKQAKRLQGRVSRLREQMGVEPLTANSPLAQPITGSRGKST